MMVAFSGGVDSTFLLKMGQDVLGEKVVAATAQSPTYPKSEYEQARNLAKKLGVKHIIFSTDELNNPDFAVNPPQRCYYCKRELFTKLRELTRKEGLAYVVDGSNLDDRNDFRPGRQAKAEMAIRSPLEEARLTKSEIRQVSRQMELPTWDKPARACLASRFPYGEKITTQKTRVIERAEAYLMGLGLKQIRVRYHGPVARIEVGPEDMSIFNDAKFRKKVTRQIKELGFTYVTLDLEGYRTGSMNEVLRYLPRRHKDTKEMSLRAIAKQSR